MSADCTDPAQPAVDILLQTMSRVFAPDAECPPVGSGSTTVRFFTSAGAPLSFWDAHNEGPCCGQPFLWVRLDSRSRTTSFPSETVTPGPCSGQRMYSFEIGVARATRMDLEADFDALDTETRISLDDSWRLEETLCAAGNRLANLGYSCASDTLIPYGPEGGITAWSGILHVAI